MKIDVTQKQLEAIVEMALTIEGTIGGGGDIENNDNSYDEESIKQLRFVKRMLLKNGYENPFSLEII